MQAGYLRDEATRGRAPTLQRRDVMGAPERLGKPPVVELAKTGRRERQTEEIYKKQRDRYKTGRQTRKRAFHLD